MIQLQNVTLFFGNQAVFNDITCTINPKFRLGLIGRNGSGKSTLLQAIAGMGELDSGDIITDGLKIAYLPQDIIMNSKKTVLYEALSDRDSQESPEDEIDEDLPLRTVEAKKTLMGLGFSSEQMEASVAHLSTGWKMRLVLAKLLLQKADFYLFDEPTNHLDIFAQEWFLDFLKHAPFGFILVCHERAFLNKACTHILELERGKASLFKGAYEAYLVHKEEQKEKQRSAYEAQQKEMQHMRETADRFKAKASKASFAQSLMKKLEKMEVIEAPWEDSKTVSMQFPNVPRSGRQVLSVKNVSKSFMKPANDGTLHNTVIFKNVNVDIERDMKVALVAANGVGKTTLLKMVTGEYPLENGSIEFGNGVTHTIFKQDQHESLNPDATIWEEISSSHARKTETELRRLLGAFLFSGESIRKKTSVLSGGEKNRLSMVKTLLHNSNFLILDEPTNHLDIPSKDILLKALKAYPGTLLFVSHDQDFVNNLATHILELTPTGAHLYPGSFDDFIEQKHYREQQNGNQSTTTPSTASQPHHTNKQASTSTVGPKLEKAARYEAQKKARRLEEKLGKLEQKQKDLYLLIAETHPSSIENSQATAELTTCQANIVTTTQEWEALLEQLKL